MDGHQHAGHQDHERARGREQPEKSPFEAEPSERAARDNRGQADPGDRQGQPRAERDDEQEPEGDTMERDGGK